jgi:hypothetical protein
MSKVDRVKAYQRSLDQQAWALDKMPDKKTRKAKAKMREQNRKEIKEELNGK